MTSWRDLFDEGPVFYEDLARLLDPKIGRLQDEIARECDLADALEYPDYVDEMFGLGLVVAQEWVVAAFTQHEVPRPAALALGPILTSGERVVQLVVHGANFWKHASAWDWDNPDQRQRTIRDAFARAGVSEDGNILWDLMTAITGERHPKLGTLSPILREWYAELRRVRSSVGP